VKYWEIIADNLSKAGWSWGCVSALDSKGRTIWIADAHRGVHQRSRSFAPENQRLMALGWVLAARRYIHKYYARLITLKKPE